MKKIRIKSPNSVEEKVGILEDIFDYENFKCVITFNEIKIPFKTLIPMKWRCGYVGIKKDHPLYKKYYGVIEWNGLVSVYGGITFSGSGKELLGLLPKGYWWFGFDTMHSSSQRGEWTLEMIKKEVLKLAEQLKKKNLILSELGR